MSRDLVKYNLRTSRAVVDGAGNTRGWPATHAGRALAGSDGERSEIPALHSARHLPHTRTALSIASPLFLFSSYRRTAHKHELLRRRASPPCRAVTPAPPPPPAKKAKKEAGDDAPAAKKAKKAAAE